MDNREIVVRFFEYLRAMINTLVKNPNDDGEMKELEYLANYIKDMIGDALESHESGQIPVLSLTIYGSRDGKTSGKFEIPRHIGIIEGWDLKGLAHGLDEVVKEWDKKNLEQPESEGFDMTPYQAIKKLGGKGK